jgi:DNA-binding Lrp family transcriptional regulator
LEGKSYQEGGEQMKDYNEKDLLILSHLRLDARMKLTDMSRATRIPVSTLFDKIKTYEGHGLIRKNTSLVRFERFGYQAKAIIVFSASRNDRKKLLEFLNISHSVNSLFKINNGWDFMAEMILPGVKEVEEFIESIEERVKLKGRKIFYIIDELKKEEFLANPKRVELLRRVTK